MANFVTLSRIVLALIALGLLYIHTSAAYIAAFILTAVVIWFDGLDGFLARLLKEDSRIGALLDILGDRIVECSYWVVFACLGWVWVIVPLIVIVRGFITDGIRSLAFEKGYTAFGKNTMMESKLGRFLVASNFSRGSYAVAKALAFVLIIVAYVPDIPQNWLQYQNIVLKVAIVCVWISVIFCVLRGLPVVIEGMRFFLDKTENDK